MSWNRPVKPKDGSLALAHNDWAIKEGLKRMDRFDGSTVQVIIQIPTAVTESCKTMSQSKTSRTPALPYDVRMKNCIERIARGTATGDDRRFFEKEIQTDWCKGNLRHVLRVQKKYEKLSRHQEAVRLSDAVSRVLNGENLAPEDPSLVSIAGGPPLGTGSAASGRAAPQNRVASRETNRPYEGSLELGSAVSGAATQTSGESRKIGNPCVSVVVLQAPAESRQNGNPCVSGAEVQTLGERRRVENPRISEPEIQPLDGDRPIERPRASESEIQPLDGDRQIESPCVSRAEIQPPNRNPQMERARVSKAEIQSSDKSRHLKNPRVLGTDIQPPGGSHQNGNPRVSKDATQAPIESRHIKDSRGGSRRGTCCTIS